MADWKCYKKFSPEIPIWLSNGAKVVFSTIDHRVGYFATQNPFIHGEFEQMMSEGRGGITEITQEEFNRDFVEKKKALGGQQLNRPWREQLNPRGGMSSDTDTRIVPQRDVAAVVASPPPPNEPIAPPTPTVAEIPAQSTAPPAPTEFKPPVVKRAKMPKKAKT